MNYIIYEDEYPNNLAPLSLLTPTYELYYGYRKLVEIFSAKLGTPAGYKLPHRFIKTASKFPSEPVDVELLVNSATKPSFLDAIKELKQGQAIYESGKLVSARGRLSDIASFERLETGDALIKGPWELIKALEDDAYAPKEGLELGRGVTIEEPSAIITRRGGVVIGDDVRIEAFSRIEGPAIISRGTIIKSARVNPHTFIGEQCRIGGEVDTSIFSDYVNKAHEGYIGHSYVGRFVNIGAGSTVSDLKNTYGTIRTRMKSIDTGMLKLGAFIADHAKLSINTSVFGGVSIGAASMVEGVIRNDVKPFLFADGKKMVLDSLLKMVDRMEKRRNLYLTDSEKALIEEATSLY